MNWFQNLRSDKSCSFGLLHVFRGRLSNFVCVFFLLGIEGRMSDAIVLIPDYCVSIYFGP